MFSRFVITAAVATAILGASPAAASTAAPGAVSSASAQSDLQALVNQYRSANGLQTVSLNGSLSSSATWMANDMAAKNYFSHTSSDGRSPAQRMAGAGYPAFASYTGEDLAAGFPGAAQVLSGWIASPAHNAVLLNPNYDAIGIGVAYSVTSTYKWYWAADFGGPGVKAAPVAPPPAPVAPPPAPVAPPPPAVAPPAAPPVAAALRPAPANAPAVAAAPSAPAAVRPASLAAAPAQDADPAATDNDQSGLASTGSAPADPAAVARDLAAAKHEDRLVRQMTRLLLLLERRTGF